MLVDEGERLAKNSHYLDLVVKCSILVAGVSTEQRRSRDCFEGTATLGLKGRDWYTSGREACSRAQLALGCDSGNQLDC